MNDIEALTRSLESLWHSEAAITFGGATNTIKTDEQMAAAIIACLPSGWRIVGPDSAQVPVPPEPDFSIMGVLSTAGWSDEKLLREQAKWHARWHAEHPERSCEVES